jgi:hypothetical protein
MNIKQLRKLVIETVREENTRKLKASSKTKFGTLVENTVKLVLEEVDVASEEPEDPQQASTTQQGAEGAAAAPEDGSGNWKPEVLGAEKLGNVDVAKAKELLQMDNPNPEDAIPVGSTSPAAKQLNPTQSSMNLKKATHFALGMLNGTMYGSGGPGGDLGAFICNNYLLDGHHRWVATCMVAPGASVNGYEIKGIDAKDAVKVLNVATAAFMGHNQGKTGSGSFADFEKPEAILAMLKECDADDVKSMGDDGKEKISTGVPGKNGAGNATKTCEQWAAGELSQAGLVPAKREEGAVQGEEALVWASQVMAKNCAAAPGVSDASVLIPGNSRIDMPVADDPEHAGEVGATPTWGKDKATQGVIDALNTGKLDLKESIDLNRWNKLAGLLKD